MNVSREPKTEDLGVGVLLRIRTDLAEIENVAIDLDHLLSPLGNLTEKCIIALDETEAIAQEIDLHPLGREFQVVGHDQAAQVRSTD